MNKIKYNLKAIKDIASITDKKRSTIFLDILKCHQKYKACVEDYYSGGMYKMNDFERKTVLTKGKNEEYQKKYNNSKFTSEINNWLKFHKNFDKYLNFEWLELNGKNMTEFKNFCKKHPKVEVIQKIKEPKKTAIKIENSKNLYQDLVKQNIEIIEEKIEENPTLKKIGEDKTSRIKIITLLGNIVGANLEIGDYNSDGLIAPIDIETGKIAYPAVNKQKKLFDAFVYLKIPKWEEVKELCTFACLEIPAVGYVEWEICIGKTNCHLMKASDNPNYNHYQLPEHRNTNVGLIPIYKQIEERILK